MSTSPNELFNQEKSTEISPISLYPDGFIKISETVIIEEEEDLKDITIIDFVDNLIPNIGSELIFVFIQLVETHFIGQMKDMKLLDAIGLAQSYNLVLLFFIGYGIIDVMDTICSRSFGKKKFYLLGTQTNQIRIIVSVYIIFLSFINVFFSSKILVLFVGNVNYIDDSYLYILLVTPSILMSLHYEIYCAYFLNQLVYKPVLLSLFVALTIHPIVCWLFISYLNMGIVGAAICTNITETVRFIFIAIWANCCNPYPKSNICLDKRVFNKFGSVFKQSLSSAALFVGESAGYNIVEYITARLGVTSFAQHITLINITMISFALAGGFMNTNAILIGNYAAQNSPSNVKKIIKISFIISLVIFIPIFIIISIFPATFLKFFSESEEIWNSNEIYEIVYIMCISNFFDFQQQNIQGFLRGLGILNITFIVSFISYCIILPGLSYTFGHYLDMKLKGIWLSMLGVNCIVLIFNYIILQTSNIDKLCEDFEDEDAIEELKDEGQEDLKMKSVVKREYDDSEY